MTVQNQQIVTSTCTNLVSQILSLDLHLLKYNGAYCL